MTDKPFWSRIKDARLFQVIVIYLAASWLVLQVVHASFHLPLRFHQRGT